MLRVIPKKELKLKQQHSNTIIQKRMNKWSNGHVYMNSIKKKLFSLYDSLSSIYLEKLKLLKKLNKNSFKVKNVKYFS